MCAVGGEAGLHISGSIVGRPVVAGDDPVFGWYTSSAWSPRENRGKGTPRSRACHECVSRQEQTKLRPLHSKLLPMCLTSPPGLFLAASTPRPSFSQSTSLSQEDLTAAEARAHVLTPSEDVPGDFLTLDGWSVSLVGNEVGCAFSSPHPSARAQCCCPGIRVDTVCVRWCG